MAQRDHRGMTPVRAPVFRLERLNLTVPALFLFNRTGKRLHVFPPALEDTPEAAIR
jgi:hypothetical protein